MEPDFNRKTVETVAKRAGFLCSNPECRILTVGPNVQQSKSTNIGEAAHIRGARSDSPRYDKSMTDATRAEITNAIWLCCNCHRKIDKDERKYSENLLFAWREDHEHYVATNLGSPSERIQTNLDSSSLDRFRAYPPIVRRIAVDKPEGWEWRLTAELMRHLNQPVLRRLSDLEAGLYSSPLERVYDGDAIDWFSNRITEMGSLFSPLPKLVPQLSNAWGSAGKPGDEEEIHHVCCLMRDSLEQIVMYEERLQFVRMSEGCQPVLKLLKNVLGNQARKIADIPKELDGVVALIGTEHGGTDQQPRAIQITLTFQLPESWSGQVNRELRRLTRKFHPEKFKMRFWSSFFWILILMFLFSAIFG